MAALAFVVLLYAPVIVFAWLISPVTGVIAVLLLLFLGAIGSDTWRGSGPYGR